MSDMKLLHFWITEGAAHFTNYNSEELNNVVPNLLLHHSLEHEFLMHELLSFSALRISFLRPQDAKDYLYISHDHRSKGLALFQRAISGLQESNCEALYLFSVLTFCHAWAAQDMNKPSQLFFIPSQQLEDSQTEIKWVQLHRGSGMIMDSYISHMRSGGLRPMFAQWEEWSWQKENHLEARDERPFDSLREAIGSSGVPKTQRETLLYTLDRLREVFCLMTFHHKVSKLSAVMSWFSLISDDYLMLLEKKMPEALVIVAYYSVAIKRLPYMWWLEGKSENLLQTVLYELGNSWESYTRWPIEQIMGSTSVASSIDPSLAASQHQEPAVAR